VDQDKVVVARAAAPAEEVDARAVVVQVGAAVGNASVPAVAREHHTSAVFRAIRFSVQNAAQR
jgi:DUF917 family protein